MNAPPARVEAVEVRTYREHAYCEHDREFRWSGMELLSYPPQYPHRADDGCEAVFDRSYPTLVHREAPSDDG